MNNRATLIIGMMTGIVITYVVCMILLYINERYDKEFNNTNNIGTYSEKANEELKYIYVLNRDVKKLEKISDVDFYKFETKDQGIDDYEFESDELINLKEKYMVCDMRENTMLKKSDLMTREEVLISIEKNSKFNNCELVEIKFESDNQINNQMQIQDYEQDQGLISNNNYNEYQEILNSFSFDKTIYVDICYQNKITNEISILDSNVKVADITEDKVTVMLANDEARRVKDIMQYENLFIRKSQNNLIGE